MAEDQQSDRNINIQSTVNVGTANDKTSVSGATVKVDSTSEVHIHNESSPPPSFRSVAIVGVLAFLSAVLVNYATSLPLPDQVKDYLWLSWPLAILVTAISIWVAYRQSRSNAISVTGGRTLDERNRDRMLEKVENFWIKGVLDQSLYQIARLELGLEQEPDKVDHPWRTVLQEAASKREVPAGTSITELFDRLDGKLLILGAPGAGKTTLLLELARDLVARARQDSQHAIPLVFNLSTWASQRQPLDKWLTIELNQRYDVPSKLATAWVEADAILPLLDGLDEVAPNQRDACVEAINTYRQKRGLVQLAVCSRVEEYGRLADKLRLEGAALIQPLTQQTVDAYLREIGRPLAAVRIALKDDPALWELLDSPLLLSIVAIAFKDKAPAKVRSASTLEQRRRQLFDDYIAAMFERRSKDVPFTRQQTSKWISWLAAQMVQHKLTVYYIERMQVDWLPQKQRPDYVRVAKWIGRLGGRLDDAFERIKLVETLRWSLSRDQLGAGLIFGMSFGLAGGMIIGLSSGFRAGLTNWLRVVLDSGLVGLVIGLTNWLVVGLEGGLVVGLIGGLLGVLIFGLGGDEVEVRTTPNQGIHRSARSWMVFGVISGLISGLIFWLIFGLSARQVVGAGAGLIVGVGTGLGLGLNYGGSAVILHYTLRWMLYRNVYLPLRLVPFLDYCTERIFLRKVGGGYIFVHRLLMEHFASLHTEQPEK